MTPFLQFRVWLRRGPTGQRSAAAVAAVLAVVLLAWAAIPLAATDDEQISTGLGLGAPLDPGPSDTHPAGGAESTSDAPADSDTNQTETGTPNSAGSRDDTGTSDAGVRNGVESGPSATVSRSDATGTSDRCASPTATDQGVTDTELFVAVPYVALAGGAANSAFGIRSPSEIEKLIAALTDAINDEGGVACRKLRTKAYPVNTIDQNDQRTKCLQIVGDKPFAVIDVGGYINEAARACFVDARIPSITSTAPNESETSGAFPYIISHGASTERQVQNWVREAPSRGWFTGSDFSKLGLFLDECSPKARQILLTELASQGISGDKISVFTMSGCGGVGSPSEVSQAMAQHRRDGVSHVFLAANASSTQNYVRYSDGLDWHPQYLASDFANQTSSTLAAQWSGGFDGAIAITSTRIGERNSGITSPWVSRCNKWLSDRGVAPSNSEADQTPMNVCDQLRLLAAAADVVGADLTRPMLAEGLARVGRFQTAVTGDAMFDRRGKVTGGDFIRAIQYHSNCNCWKIADKDTKPGH